jgi:hypothetical protein
MGTVVSLICIGYLLPWRAIFRFFRSVPAALELVLVLGALYALALWGLS